MGLDQYLYAKTYVSSSLSTEPNGTYKKIIELLGAEELVKNATYPAAIVAIQVGYWRKSNHIHNWFVDNCQDGVDDCRESNVGFSQIEDLLDLCRKTIADKTLANVLLPTVEGFFFGGTEYDDYYFEDIERTIITLENILKLIDDNYSLYYRSSW